MSVGRTIRKELCGVLALANALHPSSAGGSRLLAGVCVNTLFGPYPLAGGGGSQVTPIRGCRHQREAKITDLLCTYLKKDTSEA